MGARPEFIKFVIDGMEERDIKYRSELARKIGVSEAHVSRVLAGTTNPDWKFYRGLARAFGCSLEEVLQVAGEIRKGDVLPQARDWSLRLQQLDDHSRRQTIAAMEAALAAVEFAHLPRPVHPVNGQ